MELLQALRALLNLQPEVLGRLLLLRGEQRHVGASLELSLLALPLPFFLLALLLQSRLALHLELGHLLVELLERVLTLVHLKLVRSLGLGLTLRDLVLEPLLFLPRHLVLHGGGAGVDGGHLGVVLLLDLILESLVPLAVSLHLEVLLLNLGGGLFDLLDALLVPEEFHRRLHRGLALLGLGREREILLLLGLEADGELSAVLEQGVDLGGAGLEVARVSHLDQVIGEALLLERIERLLEQREGIDSSLHAHVHRPRGGEHGLGERAGLGVDLDLEPGLLDVLERYQIALGLSDCEAWAEGRGGKLQSGLSVAQIGPNLEGAIFVKSDPQRNGSYGVSGVCSRRSRRRASPTRYPRVARGVSSRVVVSHLEAPSPCGPRTGPGSIRWSRTGWRPRGPGWGSPRS